ILRVERAGGRHPRGFPWAVLALISCRPSCHSSLVTRHCLVDLGGVELGLENNLFALRGELAKEARFVAEMAASGTGKVGFDQERVSVAVQADFAHAQPMPRCLTLRPELLAAAAEESHLAGA